MHRTRGRVLAVLALAAGAGAGLIAVQSALNAPASDVEAARATLRSRTTSFGPARVVVRVLPNGIVCYRVIEASGSSHGCRATVRANEIGYTVAPRAIGGVAGSQGSAGGLKMTRRGAEGETPRGGGVFPHIPTPESGRAGVKGVAGGGGAGVPGAP